MSLKELDVLVEKCPNSSNSPLGTMKEAIAFLTRMRHLVHYFSLLEDDAFDQNMTKLKQWQDRCQDPALKFNSMKTQNEAISSSDIKLANFAKEVGSEAEVELIERNQVIRSIYMTSLDWKMTALVDPRMLLMHKEYISEEKLIELFNLFWNVKANEEIHKLVQKFVRNVDPPGRRFSLKDAMATAFRKVGGLISIRKTSTDTKELSKDHEANTASQIQNELDRVLSSPDLADLLSGEIETSFNCHQDFLRTLLVLDTQAKVDFKNLYRVLNTCLRDKFREIPMDLARSEFSLIWMTLFNSNTRISTRFQPIRCTKENLELNLLQHEEASAFLLIGDLCDGSLLDLVSLVVIEKDPPNDSTRFCHYMVNVTETSQSKWLQLWKRHHTNYDVSIEERKLEIDIEIKSSLSRTGMAIAACLYTLWSKEQSFRNVKMASLFYQKLKQSMEIYEKALPTVCCEGQGMLLTKILSFDKVLTKLERGEDLKMLQDPLQQIDTFFESNKRSLRNRLEEHLHSLKRMMLSEDWESASLSFSFIAFMKKLGNLDLGEFILPLRDIEKEARHSHGDMFAVMDSMRPVFRLKEFLIRRFTLESIHAADPEIWAKAHNVYKFVSNMIPFFLKFVIDDNGLKLDTTKSVNNDLDAWGKLFRSLIHESNIPEDLLKEHGLNDVFENWKAQFSSPSTNPMSGNDAASTISSSESVENDFTRASEKEKLRKRFEEMKKEYQKLWKDARKSQTFMGSSIMREARKAMRSIDALRPGQLNEIEYAKYQNNLTKLRSDLERPVPFEGRQSDSEDLKESLLSFENKNRILAESNFSLKEELQTLRQSDPSEIDSLNEEIRKLNACLDEKHDIGEEFTFLIESMKTNTKMMLLTDALGSLKTCMACEDWSQKHTYFEHLLCLGVLSDTLCTQLAFHSSSLDQFRSNLFKAVDELTQKRAAYLLKDYLIELTKWVSGEAHQKLRRIDAFLSGGKRGMLSIDPMIEALRHNDANVNLLAALNEHSTRFDSPLTFTYHPLTFEDVVILFSENPETTYNHVLNSKFDRMHSVNDGGSDSQIEMKQGGYIFSSFQISFDEASIPIFTTGPHEIEALILALKEMEVGEIQISERVETPSESKNEILICLVLVLAPILIAQSGFYHLMDCLQIPEEEIHQNTSVKLISKRIEILQQQMRMQNLENIASSSIHHYQGVAYDQREDIEEQLKEAILERERLIESQKFAISSQLSESFSNLMHHGLYCFGELLRVKSDRMDEFFAERFRNHTVWNEMFENVLRWSHDKVSQFDLFAALKKWDVLYDDFVLKTLNLLVETDPIRKAIENLCTVSKIGNLRAAHILSQRTVQSAAVNSEMLKSDCIDLETKCLTLSELCKSGKTHPKEIEKAGDEILSKLNELRKRQSISKDSQEKQSLQYICNLLLNSVGVCCSFSHALFPMNWYRDILLPKLEKAVEDGVILALPSSDEEVLKTEMDRMSCRWQSCTTSLDRFDERCSTNPFQLAWKLAKRVRDDEKAYQTVSFIGRNFAKGVIECHSHCKEFVWIEDEIVHLTNIVKRTNTVLSMSVEDLNSQEIKNEFERIESALSSLNETMALRRKHPTPFIQMYLQKMCAEWYFRSTVCSLRNLCDEFENPVLTAQNEILETKEPSQDPSSLLILANFQDLISLRSDLAEKSFSVDSQFSEHDLNRFNILASLVAQIPRGSQQTLVKRWEELKTFSSSWILVEKYKGFLDTYRKIMTIDVKTLRELRKKGDFVFEEAFDVASNLTRCVSDAISKEIAETMQAHVSGFETRKQNAWTLIEECRSLHEAYENHLQTFAKNLDDARKTKRNWIIERLSNLFQKSQNDSSSLRELAEKTCGIYEQIWMTISRSADYKSGENGFVSPYETCRLEELSDVLHTVVKDHHQLYIEKHVKEDVDLSKYNLRYGIAIVDLTVMHSRAFFNEVPDGTIWIYCEGGLGVAVIDAKSGSIYSHGRFYVTDEKAFKLKMTVTSIKLNGSSMTIEMNDLNSIHLMTLPLPSSESRTQNMVLTLETTTYKMFWRSPFDPRQNINDGVNSESFDELHERLLEICKDFDAKRKELKDTLEEEKKAEKQKKVYDKTTLRCDVDALRSSKAKQSLNQAMATLQPLEDALRNASNVLKECGSSSICLSTIPATMKTVHELSISVKDIRSIILDASEMTISSEEQHSDLKKAWNPEMKDSFVNFEVCFSKMVTLGSEATKILVTTSKDALCQIGLRCNKENLLSNAQSAQDDWGSSVKELHLEPTWNEIVIYQSQLPFRAVTIFAERQFRWIRAFDEMMKMTQQIRYLNFESEPFSLVGTRLSHLAKLVVVQSDDGSFSFVDGNPKIDFGTLLHESDIDCDAIKGQTYSIEVMNQSTTSMIIAIHSNVPESSFSLLSPKKIRLCAKTTHCFHFTIDPKASGSLDEQWRIESEDVTFERSFRLQANIQRLAIQLTPEVIDFGVLIPNPEEQKEHFQYFIAKNFTDLPILIKSQIEKKNEQSTLSLQTTKLILPPREEKLFGVTLKPGTIEESIENDIVVVAVQKLKRLTVKARIVAPRYHLLNDSGSRIDKIYHLPNTRKELNSKGTIHFVNTGEVPIDFTFSSNNGLEVSPSSGMMALGQKMIVNLEVHRSSRTNDQSDLTLSIKGCEPRHIVVIGKTFDPTLIFGSDLVFFEITADSLSQAQGNGSDFLALRATNTIVNNNALPVAVSAPKCECFQFNRESYVVKADDTLEFEMLWKATKLDLRPHPVVFVTDSKRKISFNVQMKVPDPESFQINPSSLIVLKSIEPGRSNRSALSIKSKSRCTVWTSVPVTPQVESLMLECDQPGNKGDSSLKLGSKTTPESYEFRTNPFKFKVSLKVKGPTGWIVESLHVNANGSVFVQDDLLKSRALEHCITVVAHVSNGQNKFNQMISNVKGSSNESRQNKNPVAEMPDLFILDALAKHPGTKATLTILLYEMALLQPHWDMDRRTAESFLKEDVSNLDSLMTALLLEMTFQKSESTKESFEDYVQDILRHCQETQSNQLTDLILPTAALEKTDAQTVRIARSLYMLLHADCPEHERWKAAIACMKLLMPRSNDAAFLGMASDALWQNMQSKTTFLQENVLAVKKVIFQSEFEIIDGLRLLDILFEHFDDEQSDEVLKDTIQKMFTDSQLSSTEREVLRMALMTDEIDSWELLKDIIKPDIMKRLEMLCSSDPYVMATTLKNLHRLTAENIKDELINHLLMLLSQKPEKTRYQSSLAPEKKAKKSISQILQIYGFRSLLDPVCALCAKENEGERNHSMRMIAMEMVFMTLPKFVSNTALISKIKNTFGGISQRKAASHRWDPNALNAISSKLSKPERKKQSTMIKKWLDLNPAKETTSSVINFLVDSVAFIIKKDRADATGKTLCLDEMKDSLNKAFSLLDPTSISENTPLWELVSKTMRCCMSLSGNESFVNVADVLMNFNENLSEFSFLNFCDCLASETSDTRLKRIINILRKPEDDDFEENLLQAIVPEDSSLDAAKSIIQSGFDDDMVIDENCIQRAQSICSDVPLKAILKIAPVSRAMRRLNETNRIQRNSIEYLLNVKAFVDSIRSLGDWNKTKRKSASAVDIFFSLSAFHLVDSSHEEASAFCKMCLLISLANFCKTQCWNQKEKEVSREMAGLLFSEASPPPIPLPEEPKMKAHPAQAVHPSVQEDKNASECSSSDWVWLVDDVEISDEQMNPTVETAKDDKNDDSTSSRAVSDNIDEQLRKMETHLKSMQTAVNAEEFLQKAREDGKALEAFDFECVMDIISQLKMTADTWIRTFEEIVYFSNCLGNRTLENHQRIVPIALEIVSLIKFMTQYLDTVSIFKIPENLLKTSNIILRNLEAIPQGNLPEKIKILLEKFDVQAKIKGVTTDDFPMPAPNRDFTQTTSRQDIASNQSSVSEQNPSVQEIDSTARSTGIVGYLKNAISSYREEMNQYQKGIDKLETKIDILKSSKPASSLLVPTTSRNQSPNKERIENQGNLEIPMNLTHQQTHSPVRTRKNVKHQALEENQLCDILTAAPEDENMIWLKSSWQGHVEHVTPTLHEHDIVKIYKNTDKTRAAVETREVKDPIDCGTLARVERWTYDLLINSESFTIFLTEVMRTFETHFAKFYSSIGERHVIEWCIMVDNSGSMTSKEMQTMEALVLAMEALKRLEFPFAVARFGDRHSQQMLKNMDETYTREVGQKILDSFSFDQGTFPATGLLNIAEKVWPFSLSESKSRNHHRVMLMILDGLTQERVTDDYIRVCKKKSFDLVVLNLEDDAQRELRQQIHRLWDAVTTCYEMLNLKDIDLLPKIIADLLMNQMDKICDEIEKRPSPILLEGNFAIQDVFPGRINPLAFDKILLHLGQQSLPPTLAAYEKRSFFDCGFDSEGIPFFESASKLGLEKTKTHCMELASDLEETHVQWNKVQLDSTKSDTLTKAGSAWIQTESRLSDRISRMREALEALLPPNVYTRKKADIRGPTIHLQGFIKHLATQGNEKKIFANKKGGGKANYSVVILLDISSSMTSDRKRNCALEAVFMIIESLKQMNILNFSVIAFGGAIYPIKLPDMDWGDASIAALINLSKTIDEITTLDADALLFASELLDVYDNNKPKKIFVVTDGYGSTGVKLSAALGKMKELGIDVIAMGVGPEAFFVSCCYSTWITAAFPEFLPNAIEALVDQIQNRGTNQSGNQTDVIDWTKLVLLPEAAKSFKEVFATKDKIFPNLVKDMRTEREIKLKFGNKPSLFTIDVCFVLDCSGSMSAYISKIKEKKLIEVKHKNST